MHSLFFDLSLILVVAAVLSYFAVLLRQPIIIGYMAAGLLIGPWGLGWVKEVAFIENISHLGITLLLFLAGLCLHPQKLIGLFRETGLIAFANCAISFIVAFSISWLLRFSPVDSVCIGLALMFSSTILVVKLLPTTRLHHERMGAICISILIVEDFLAIAVMAFIRSFGATGHVWANFGMLAVKLLAFIGILVFTERFILLAVMRRMERIHEALFILGLAWCFGIASISNQMGLFYETGAFFAGVILARHKISFFISEQLKPLRDFFLVLFFFSLGAKIDVLIMKTVFLPALLLAIIFIELKPWLFSRMFIASGEERAFSREVGMRLGQLSEFSLLIALLAFQLGHVSYAASQLIQLVTILTFIMSSYIVVLKYPTPIGTRDALIRH